LIIKGEINGVKGGQVTIWTCIEPE
jgi:hypothetical protein